MEAVWESLQEAYHKMHTWNIVISVFCQFKKKINTQPKDHELFTVNGVLIVKKINADIDICRDTCIQTMHVR